MLTYLKTYCDPCNCKDRRRAALPRSKVNKARGSLVLKASTFWALDNYRQVARLLRNPVLRGGDFSGIVRVVMITAV